LAVELVGGLADGDSDVCEELYAVDCARAAVLRPREIDAVIDLTIAVVVASVTDLLALVGASIDAQLVAGVAE
jgi:hypothetical protein